jgi:hypothetical protein
LSQSLQRCGDFSYRYMSIIILLFCALFVCFVVYVVVTAITQVVVAVAKKKYGKAITMAIAVLVFFFLLYKISVMIVNDIGGQFQL